MKSFAQKDKGVKSAVDSYKFTARVKGRLDPHFSRGLKPPRILSGSLAEGDKTVYSMFK